VRLIAVSITGTQVNARSADDLALYAFANHGIDIIDANCDRLGETPPHRPLFSATMLRQRLTPPNTIRSARFALMQSVTLRTFVLRGVFATLLFTSATHAATITGTVFEDVNYGGGAGRSLAASSGVGIAGVRVELYRTSTGALVDTDTTAAGGTYSLSSGGGASGAATHIVRVVNGMVRSSRTGGAACSTCVPIQTFRTDASSGTAVDVTNAVGGSNPALSDAASNTGSNNYSTLTVLNVQVPQSVTPVDPAASGSTIANVNFGFNFDTIVNTRDAASCTASGSGNTYYPCQGALRQFIINANALGGEGSLSQIGSGQIDGLTTSLPSGYESSIFMIPTGAVAAIDLLAVMTTISGSNTRLDATTQTVNIGNTNGGTVGTGGTVGVDAISLPAFQRPEVQLNAGDTIVTLSGASQHIVGLALRQGGILLSGSNAVARHNLVGMSASGDSSLATNSIGIAFQGTGATVRHNFVTVNNSGIRTDNSGAGSIVTLNEVARPSGGHTTTFDGILLVGTVSNTQVVANLTRDQRGGGIEVGFGGGASASNITVSNNTVQNNGYTSGSTPSAEPAGFVAYAYAGTNVQIIRNRLVNNAGAGVLVATANNTTISQNSFSNNGGLSIDLDPRGLDPNTMTTLQGVTLNDNSDADAGPNGLRNYAVINSAYIIGGELTINGFARPGSAIELYIAQTDPSGFGEGLSYLGTLTEGSGADLNATTGTYGPAVINGVAQGTDTTNRFTFRFPTPGGVSIGTALSSTATISGETSEFGGNVIVTGGPSLAHVKSVQVVSDPANGTTNPKSIPGAVQLYTVRITNQGALGLDNNSVSIVDAIHPATKLFVGNLGAPGSGPIAFTNGTPSSGLTWTFTALNNITDDLQFSNDNGATWAYAPTADAEGCDVAVTHIRMQPKGTMPGNGGGDPYFELRFRVVVR
jgi:hypothetical protein